MIDPSAVTDTQALLGSRVTASAKAIALTLLKDLGTITRPFVLILDDYHDITDLTIHNSVTTLLSNLPPTVRVVVISRTEAPIALARLRGRQQVLEFNAEYLRFTDDEALELLHHTNGLDIEQREVDALNAKAEGWVAGLQLVGHLLRGQSRERIQAFTREFTGNVRMIENYLWEEVINQQSDEIRRFLVRTSILNRFDASLCDVITESGRSAAILRELERDRLFVVPLDDVGHWYRYHHLFADVLRERLNQDLEEDDILDLHRRAAAWLQDNGQIDEAARHAVVGRDWDQAIPLLEQVSTALYDQDRNYSLHERLRLLPEHVLRRSPLLAFHLGFAMARVGRYEEAMVPTRIAEEAWLVAHDTFGLGRVRLTQAQRNLFAQSARQAIGEATEAVSFLQNESPSYLALAYITLGAAHNFCGEVRHADAAFASARSLLEQTQIEWLRYTEMVFSSGVLVQTGKLHEAETLLHRVGLLSDHTHSIQYQHALYRLGDLYYEFNDIDKSERTFRHAVRMSEETQTATWRGRFCMGLARVAWVKGDAGNAFAELDNAIDYSQRMIWTKLARDARALQARFWLATGQTSLAVRWSISCGLDPFKPVEYERHYELLTFVRTCIADGRTTFAIKLLNDLAVQATESGRVGDMVEIDVLRAIAYKSQGESTEALAAAENALQIAQWSGHVRTFIDEGEAILPLLRHAAVRGAHRQVAKALLEQCEGQPALAGSSQADSLDALSEREIEVMRLVAAGLPNREIGERLYISEKTVKKHLSRILSKLGATNRTQAADQARKLNLI